MKMKLITLAILTVHIPSLFAASEESPDPYTYPNKEKVESKLKQVGTHGITICYEDFSLPLATAARLQREQLPDSELYSLITSAVEKETAKQESFVILRGRSGEKVSSKGVCEELYPTEYEPAELPNSVGISISPPEVDNEPLPIPDSEKLKNAPVIDSRYNLRTPATPTAFLTRNTGLSIEAETTLGQDGKIVDLRIIPEHVNMVDRSSWGQEISTLDMPTFEAQVIQTSATVSINSPYLLGTMNRTPNSKVDPDSANRVWFAFVTVTLAKP